MSETITLKKQLENNSEFKNLCKSLDIPCTKRQLSKYNRKKGIVYGLIIIKDSKRIKQLNSCLKAIQLQV